MKEAEAADERGRCDPREDLGRRRQPLPGQQQCSDGVVGGCVDRSQSRRLAHHLHQAKVGPEILAALDAVGGEEESGVDEQGARRAHPEQECSAARGFRRPSYDGLGAVSTRRRASSASRKFASSSSARRNASCASASRSSA